MSLMSGVGRSDVIVGNDWLKLSLGGWWGLKPWPGSNWPFPGLPAGGPPCLWEEDDELLEEEEEEEPEDEDDDEEEW